MTTEDLPWITVKDLIDKGYITAPATLQGERNGMLFEVSLEADGTFTWKDRRFSSPSLAAGQLITLATNDRTPGRGYFSVNGWNFWKVRSPDGILRTLSEIRSAAGHRT